MYFRKFQDIFYQFNINGEKQLLRVKDITQNVRFRKEILDSIVLYDVYDVKDGETPEIIADRMYNDSKYHWVIMMFNERFNYLTDWPMSSDVLEQYIYEKYTVLNPDGTVDDQATRAAMYATHHWENSQGLVVMPNTYQSTAVTNYDYETKLNDAKRRIKLVSPTIIADIVTQFRAIL